MLTLGTSHELDRGIGGWHVEWLAFPLVFGTSAATVEAIYRALASLTVDTEIMSRNAGVAAPPIGSIDSVLARYQRVVPG